MLNRQKILLHLLQEAGRPVSRTELTKWSFLLRHESESRGGNAFYDFVPYRRGPFSFALYQEVDKLIAQNYARPSGDHAWRLGEVVPPALPHSRIKRDTASVVAEFGQLESEELLNYVYERYPLYTVNSEIERLAQRPTTTPAVFTAGYEGISIDGFLALLTYSGIERIIDVRHNPVARRYGFHKSTLKRLSSNLQIDYVHVPELGIHSENRQHLESMNDRKKLFESYERTTLKTESQAIARVAELVQDRPSALVCMEAEPSCCHRSHLAATVAEITALPVQHLQAA